MKRLLTAVLLCLSALSAAEPPAGRTPVYVVPVQGEINTAQFYIIRRALKEAAAQKAAVVLDMNTPGGALDATLDIMDALSRFDGATLTYVNAEAASAGSYIAVATQEIWFAPKGVMGAAEAVSATGEDISASMQRKLTSFMAAKVRTLTGESRYRAEVQRAMMDPAYVLKIDGKVLKPAGELLSLTAAEAMAPYGTPPEPLLAAGVADSVDKLLDQRFGAGAYEKRDFALTGAEHLAVWLRAIAPLLLGLGGLLIYIEFKTPGFGVFGILGGILLVLFFAGNYLAGLAGYEPLILFAVGVVLLAVELFWVQGLLIPGITAVIFLLTAVLWSGADLWPDSPQGVSWESFLPALKSFVYGSLLAGLGIFLAARYVPARVYRGALVLEKSLAPEPVPQEKFPPVGSEGMVVTALRPEGVVEIEGRRYPARARLGELPEGAAVSVEALDAFCVIVRKIG